MTKSELRTLVLDTLKANGIVPPAHEHVRISKRRHHSIKDAHQITVVWRGQAHFLILRDD